MYRPLISEKESAPWVLRPLQLVKVVRVYREVNGEVGAPASVVTMMQRRGHRLTRAVSMCVTLRLARWSGALRRACSATW